MVSAADKPGLHGSVNRNSVSWTTYDFSATADGESSSATTADDQRTMASRMTMARLSCKMGT
ncbi:MAG TPA: hypothetical protein VE890_02235 [Thermoguttaceae bacterium]|nr:hypothetical protein [Thermoguttaceae bacterium]